MKAPKAKQAAHSPRSVFGMIWVPHEASVELKVSDTLTGVSTVRRFNNLFFRLLNLSFLKGEVLGVGQLFYRSLLGKLVYRGKKKLMPGKKG